MTQSEQELEQNLIQRLTGLGYEPVTLSNAAALTANLKTQLEKHNGIKLSDTEFKSILNHLDKCPLFVAHVCWVWLSTHAPSLAESA